MINLFVIILVYAIYLFIISVQETFSSKETFLSQNF